MPPALQSNRTAKNIATIKRIVADTCGFTVDQIDSRSKPKSLAHARHIAMWITRQLITSPVPFSDPVRYAPMSYPDIAASFHRSDHMSAIYACLSIGECAQDALVQSLFRECRRVMQ